MVHALASSLFLLAVSRSQSSCEGTCDAVRESSVLMQRKSRNKQLPLRQATQAAGSESMDLFQATAQLLRGGATPDVIEFTNTTLEALETDILPNLLHGYDTDVAMLDEFLANVENVLAEFEKDKATLQPFAQAEADAIAEHHSCRQRETLSCEDHKVCHESCFHLNETYISTETDYLAITETIHHRWCEDGSANKSAPVWRESMSERFSHFLKLGERRIEEKRALITCMTECESKSWHSVVEADLLQVRGKAQVAVDHEGEGRRAVAEASWNPCDEKQRAMEHASCSLEEHRAHMNRDFATEWDITTTSFNDLVVNVKQREELRHRDFKVLKGIKCLLKHIIDRAGKPCDEEDEPGVADAIIEDCESYYQIDVHMLLTPWNITYPELPEKAAPVPATPHPCSPEWVDAQYGWLSGECFSDMPVCQPCVSFGPICCKAMTAECLACAAEQSEEEYCQAHPATAGCEHHVVVQR